MTTQNQALSLPLCERSVEMNSLIVACESITQEAFTFADVGRIIQTKVGKLSAAFKDMARFMTTWDYSQPDVLNVSSLNRVLTQGVRYVDIVDISVYKPVSFKGEVEAYTQQWGSNQIRSLTSMLGGLLFHEQKFLGYYLNDPLNLNDKRITQSFPPQFNKVALDNIIELEKRWYLDNGKDGGEVTIGDLYPSISSMLKAMNNINALNHQRWHQANPKTITKEFLSYTALAEALFETIRGGEHTVTPVVLQELASRIELVARWIETYAMLTVHLSDMTTALKLTETKLLKSF